MHLKVNASCALKTYAVMGKVEFGIVFVFWFTDVWIELYLYFMPLQF